MPNLCKGGCGKELPATNKSGFAWGHSNGCPSELLPPPGTSEAIPVKEAAEAQPEPIEVVECLLSEYQLDAIWKRLTLPWKASAILHALDCEY